MNRAAGHPGGQIWILYRRPAEVSDPRDWPAPFCARRFDLVDGVPSPTDDLLGAETFGELVALLPDGLDVHPRTPEDPSDIIETRGAIPPPSILREDGRLSSGMKVEEAAARAELWWNLKGRKILKKKFNRQRGKNKVRVGRGMPSFVVPGEEADVIPSGILRGLPWAGLTRDEQLRIVKVWHREFIEDGECPIFVDDGKLLVPGASNTPS